MHKRKVFDCQCQTSVQLPATYWHTCHCANHTKQITDICNQNALTADTYKFLLHCSTVVGLPLLMGHIYFSGDDVDSGPSTSTGPAAGSTRFAHCCSRARVSYDEANPCYVFKAIRSPDSCSIAAALSSNSIKLFSCSVAGLSHAGDIAAHQGTISDIQFPFVSAPQALYSCSRDGYVKGWDLRSGQQAEG